MNAPEGLLESMAQAGIVGRGGASFPTHLKWKRVKELVAAQVYVVCNASEGEPGVHKDGYLLEHFPEKVIEGMTIALDFLGASEAYFNINERYFKLYGTRLEAIARYLIKHGLRLTDNGRFADFAILHGRHGMTMPCDWLVFEHGEKYGQLTFRKPCECASGLDDCIADSDSPPWTEQAGHGFMLESEGDYEAWLDFDTGTTIVSFK